MPNRQVLALLLLALLAPAEGRAEAYLELGMEGAVEYDDNVLFRSDDVQADGVVRLGPRLELRDEQGQLQYLLRYFPSYEKFFDLSELDGWNHDAYASLTWEASPRTRFSVREQYIDSNRAVRVFEENEPIDPAGEAAGLLGTQGFQQNIAGAELQRKLSRIDLLTLNVQNVLSENDPLAELAVTEGDVTSGGLSWLRTLSGQDQAGFVLRYTRQEFENVTEAVSSRSDYYNASLQWIHKFDPTWTLSLSGGPAWVSTEPQDQQDTFAGQPLYPVVANPSGRGPVLIETCPTLDDGTPVLAGDCEVLPEGRILVRGAPAPPDSEFVFREDLAQTTDLGLIGDLPDDSTSGLTYFAAASLSKQWRTLTATLRYSRDASTTASAAGNVRDIVQGNLLWRPTERLRLGLVASWEQRESATTGFRFDRALAPASAVAIDSRTGLVGISSIGQSAGFRAQSVDRTTQNVRYTVALNAQYTITRRASLFAKVSWIQQRVDDVFSNREATRFNVVLGLRYYLEPINLPI